MASWHAGPCNDVPHFIFLLASHHKQKWKARSGYNDSLPLQDCNLLPNILWYIGFSKDDINNTFHFDINTLSVYPRSPAGARARQPHVTRTADARLRQRPKSGSCKLFVSFRTPSAQPIKHLYKYSTFQGGTRTAYLPSRNRETALTVH